MTFQTSDPEITAKVQEWMTWDKNDTTRAEIQSLVDADNVTELRKRLCSRMTFGTAGLRARMGAGYSMMNDLTIVQTSQGLLRYCQKVFPDLKENGIIFGYDARYNSSRFAWLSACIFLNAGVPVYLYRQICPTPFVPYAVLHFGCKAGVMVTASHNPKEDNGYKVYWDNGAQIIPPHDEGIANCILESLEPQESSWKTDIVDTSPLRKEPFDEIMKCYFDDVTGLCHYIQINQETPLKFTYSAMHGVGWHFCEESFKKFGLKPFIPVTQQVEPDPEFPTVKFPNPEEGKSALNLSFETADKNGSTVILANDPDADRLAVAEKQGNEWKVFTGNEIGSILGWWSLHCFKQKHPDKVGPDVYMLSSTVSSKILNAIAKKEGISFEDTLTGFKWMGNRAHDLMKEGKTVLFAFEEAIGFMCGTKVLDKDGVSACAVMAECAAYLNTQHLTLNEKLQQIYKDYGFHTTNNSYYLCYDKVIISKIFERLRNYSTPQSYPQQCGEFTIKNVRDLTTGYDDNFTDKQARLPVSSSSEMITFYFHNGCVATLRTSGTEPKIKYYTEYCSDPSKSVEKYEVISELEKLVNHMVLDFLEPEKNGLTARSN